MTKVNFLDSSTIQVVALDGEIFILKTYLSVLDENQQLIATLLAKYFTENFSNDKSSMIYWVLMKMMANQGFSFYYGSSDRSAERERIGKKFVNFREGRNRS
ncbi:MAG: hypothetical protein IPF68_06605 [Bacteroidales bacterium]|nr:hypothetical protein [Bacteroidales bacterium]